jgi:3-hydroxyisobutyrate dehydrogenase/glyoxylate/succinic semialdehyde reductase
MKVGFIGLGIMGTGMVTNLLQDGHELIVTNRTAAKAEPLVDQGATFLSTPAEVAAAKPDLLITMLAHPEAVEAVAFGPDGFLDALPPESLWLDSTTSNPSFVRRMAAEAAQRDIRFLDAPVLGTKPQAAGGELFFMIGGDAADIDAARPALESMGNRIEHVGPLGMGISLKLVFNNFLATSFGAFAEGMVLGLGLGIPEGRLLDLLTSSPITPPAITRKRGMMEAGDYSDTQFPLALMQKDLHMVATAAYDVGAAMPSSNAAKEVFQLAVRAGWGNDDFSAVYQFLKDRAGDS